MVGSAQHELARWLTETLQPVYDLYSSHLVKDSFAFCEKIRELPVKGDDPYMCSFDVKSLFTNVPINETIQICLDALYRNPNVTPPALEENLLKKLLQKSTSGVEFSFNGQMYRQIDGVAMGSPLGPILANIFLGHCESKIPDSEWPEMYQRYVDDTFSLFVDGRKSAEQFMTRLRSLHKALEFTMEGEEAGKLPFLDVLVMRDPEEQRYFTSIYRKPTFTGLYTRWDSYSSTDQKIALIRSLTTRAKRICSPHLLSTEIIKLKKIFQDNGYPLPIVDRVVQRTLVPKERPPTVECKPVYLRLPWLGEKSAALKSKVRQVTMKAAPWCAPIVCFSKRPLLNTSNKDVLPADHKSNVIYFFNCVCGHGYVGRTTQRLSERVGQHIPAALLDVEGKHGHVGGQQDKTRAHSQSKRETQKGKIKKDPLELKPSDSGITRHLKTSPDCLMTIRANPKCHFSILAHARHSSHLAVLEALFIGALKPELCAQKDFVRSLVLFR